MAGIVFEVAMRTEVRVEHIEVAGLRTSRCGGRVGFGAWAGHGLDGIRCGAYLLDAVANGLELIGKVRAAGVGPEWTNVVGGLGCGLGRGPSF